LEEQAYCPPSSAKNLLEAKGAVKWVALGDANTKFFHAQATIKYRRNLITQLIDDQDNTIDNYSNNSTLI